MRLRGWVGLATCCVAGVLALGIVGCSPTAVNDPGKSYNRESVDNLLEFFAYAYSTESIEKYTESLDESYSFTFEVADYDSAQVPPDKPYWGYEEDIERTNKMFSGAAPRVIGVSFDWYQPVVKWDAAQDSVWVSDPKEQNGGHYAIVSGFMSTWRPDIKVTVEGKAGETDKTYWVHTSWITVTAIKDRNNPKLWTILRLREDIAPQ